jgi:hypothetical protein
MTVDQLKSAEIITHYLMVGAIELASIDNKSGQMLYYIRDKMQYVDPKLYYYVKEGFLDGQVIH